MARFMLLAVVLAGCAPLEWTRPDVTPEQTRADAEDCQRRAWQESQSRAFGWPMYRAARWRDPFWADRYYDESRLTRFCMEIRGYTLQSMQR